MVVSYITVDEFRNLTNIQPAEYSNEQIEQLIETATSEIDKRTGRTWQGIQTVSNEYYDGDNSNELQLKQNDIVAISALSISEDNSTNFTTVDVSKVILYDDIGLIKLDSEKYSTLEVDYFYRGSKNIKISYTYGNSVPDNNVKNICAFLVLYYLKLDDLSKEITDKRISLLRTNSTTLI